MDLKRMLLMRLPSPFPHDENRLRLTYASARKQTDDQVLALEELVALTSVDAPLVEGLGAAAEDARVSALRKAFAHLQACLVSGGTLSDGMRRIPSLFSGMQADLVELGERTGRIEACLRRLLENALGRQRASSVLEFVLAYLALVVVWHVFVTSFWVRYLASELAMVFEDFSGSGAVLPIVLRVTSGSAPTWMRMLAAAPWLLVAVGLATMAWVRFRGMRHPDGIWRGLAGRFALGLPCIGQIGRKRMLAECMTALAQLLRAGMPLDEALDRLGDFDVDPAYRDRFRALADRIRAGDSLAQALARPQCRLPRGVTAAARLGEASGLLPESLERIARLYQIQADARADVAARLVPAAAIFLLAFVTFLLASSVFATLTYIADTLAMSI